MRFSLLAFALFAFTLVGCADDLTGPEFTTGVTSGDTAARTADAPAPAPEPASPLFSTWSGTDGRTTFALTFQERDASNASDIFSEADLSVRFEGIGSYREASDFNSALPCRIVDGMFEQDKVSFDIESLEGGAIASAFGTVSSDYEVIVMKMKYDDGTVVDVPFKKIDAPSPTEIAGS